MNHVTGIRNSIAVDNHLVADFNTHSRIQNIDGYYWSKFAHLVIGAKDLRARAGTFSTPWQAPVDDMYPMPELKFVDYRLCDLFDQRAIELNELAKKSNKKIALMWSGGIDSTSVLVSFLKNLSVADLENVEVVLSTESIIENFDFYKNFISSKLKCIHLSEFDMCNATLEKYMLLHGDPGDCVFGPTSTAFRHLFDTGRHNFPWQDNLHLISEFFDMDRSVNRELGFGKWYVDRASQNLREVNPENVTTVADWWWWHYFNFKWPTAIVRPFMHLRKNYKAPIDRKHRVDYADYTYFNTEAFQQWSYSNLKNHFKHIDQGKRGIKWEAKAYIFEFDKNEMYANEKIKIASKSPDFELRSLAVSPLYYDQDWIGYHPWEPGVKSAALGMLESFKG